MQWLASKPHKLEVLGSSPKSATNLSRCRVKVTHLLWEQDQAGALPVISTILALAILPRVLVTLFLVLVYESRLCPL